MEYSSRIFVPNISAKYFRRNAIKKKGKSGQLTTLAPIQWRIQDFPEGSGRQFPNWVCQPIILQLFAENCMKIHEFGPGGVRDPPLQLDSIAFSFNTQ